MKNFIFYLISKIIKTNASVLSDWNIERGKETPNSLAPYYFHLPLKDEENFSVQISEENEILKLIEHHITIHELQIQEHAQYKSPYHYTAIFLDQKEEKNKLHLFFNAKDKICWATFSKFSVLSKSYADTVTLDAESITQFELFSKPFIFNLIPKIRHQQNLYISELTEQCVSLNTQAEELSKNITAENVQFYIEHLGKYITALQETYQLSGQNNQGIQNILLRRGYELKKQFSTSKITPCFVEQCSETKNEGVDLSDTLTIHPVPLRLSVIPIDLDPKITLLKTQTIPTIIKPYLSIYNDYLELSSEIALCTHDTKVSMLGLSIFEKIASQLTIKGTALLQKAILENSFQEAAKLNMFHSTMPLKYLNMALMIGNAPMLEFLLHYGPYCIDTQAITTSKKDYQSILHYLIEGELKIESKIACFQILMQQGASLLTCNQDGLPWAHFLLSQTNACTQALYSRIPMDILHTPAFYKQLIALLTPHQHHPEIQTALSKYTSYYSSLISATKDSDLRTKKITSDMRKNKAEFVEKLGINFITDLRNDPEIQSLSTLLSYVTLECKNIMTIEQWNHVGATTEKNQKDILNADLSKEIIKEGFLAIKDDLKHSYTDAIQYWKEMTQFYQLKKEYQSKPLNKRASNQKTKLLQSIQAYQKKYHLKNESETCEIDNFKVKLNKIKKCLHSQEDVIEMLSIFKGTLSDNTIPNESFGIKLDQILSKTRELTETKQQRHSSLKPKSKC